MGVNVAARMMSGSMPGCVNVSEQTYKLLCDEFDAIDRGELNVKGKGKMRQYFITGGKLSRSAREAAAVQMSVQSRDSLQPSNLPQLRAPLTLEHFERDSIN